VTEQDFETHLAHGHETNGVEFKGPGARTEGTYFLKVVRAILGMANRRDGGFVILGVEDANLDPVGLSDEEANSWLNFDNLSASVNAYASPSVSLNPEALNYRGRKFVVIRVDEFADIPVLCCKEGHDKKGKQTLRPGACYVRARHKPEMSDIPTEEEMRELLELAIDKGVRKFVTRAQRAGLFPGVSSPPMSRSDEERFNDQIEDLG